MDDHFKRVHDHRVVDNNRTFESSKDLEDVSADELALIVKDPNDPTKLNLGHSAFLHPRVHWDKILTSPNFKNVSKTELDKLFVLNPAEGRIIDNEDGDWICMSYRDRLKQRFS